MTPLLASELAASILTGDLEFVDKSCDVDGLISVLKKIPSEHDDITRNYAHISREILTEEEREVFDSFLDAIDTADTSDTEVYDAVETIQESIAGLQSSISMSTSLAMCLWGATTLLMMTALCGVFSALETIRDRKC